MPAIVYRIDYRPPGWQEFQEGVSEYITCAKGPEPSLAEIADAFRTYEGHRFGLGEFRAIRED